MRNATPRQRGIVTSWVLLGCLLAGAGGCRQRTPDKPAVTLRLSGAFALYPMAVQWGQEYHRLHPEVRLAIVAGGAGKGMLELLGGQTELAMVSRELAGEESRRGAQAIPVARDAVVCIISSANPAAGALTANGPDPASLGAVWLGTGTVTWARLAGSGLDLKVQPYSRSDSCGAGETWARYLGARQEDLGGIRRYGDPGVIEAVRKDPSGIGYCNLNFAYNPQTGLPLPGLAVLPLRRADGGPLADLSSRVRALKAIRSGTYPAPPARDLYLVARAPLHREVADFLSWVLGPGQNLVEPAGYLPVSAAQVAGAAPLLAGARP
jgi:phosphate transport system substrate-binding protein